MSAINRGTTTISDRVNAVSDQKDLELVECQTGGEEQEVSLCGSSQSNSAFFLVLSSLLPTLQRALMLVPAVAVNPSRSMEEG